jgi:hypothetical protein
LIRSGTDCAPFRGALGNFENIRFTECPGKVERLFADPGMLARLKFRTNQMA